MILWIDFDLLYRFLGPVESNNQLITQQRRDQELQIVSEDCNTKKKVEFSFIIYFKFKSAYSVFLDVFLSSNGYIDQLNYLCIFWFFLSLSSI